MPYKANKDLPDSVKNSLPDHAQTIYRKAFNSSWKKYDSEETVHRVAWGAVKKVYEKRDNKWVKKRSE